MPNLKIYIKTYKAITMMLVVAFSLSPCSLKRDLLEIFDIQHINTLNKVKTTTHSFSGCQNFNSSLKSSVSKVDFKWRNNVFYAFLKSDNFHSEKKKFSLKNYSGNASGTSPPKYILFKRLKLDMI